MSHFAKLDENNIVVQVLVIEQDVIDTGLFGDPATWVQTSYNTRGNVYYTPNTSTPDPDQSKALRKNYACIGYTYDTALDAFIPPKPEAIDGIEWVLDTSSGTWSHQSINSTPTN
jgi:hypothetical protein